MISIININCCLLFVNCILEIYSRIFIFHLSLTYAYCLNTIPPLRLFVYPWLIACKKKTKYSASLISKLSAWFASKTTELCTTIRYTNHAELMESKNFSFAKTKLHGKGGNKVEFELTPTNDSINWIHQLFVHGMNW